MIESDSKVSSSRISTEVFETLPSEVRLWIADLETRCDHTGQLAELRLLEEAFEAQTILLAEQKTQLIQARELLHKSLMSYMNNNETRLLNDTHQWLEESYER